MKQLKKILYFFCTSCRPNTSPTVRYAFPLVFTVAALLGAAAVISNNKSYIHLESSVESVRAGETFQIDVFVSANVPVNAVDISLVFPKQQIIIMGIDTGESVITLWTQEPFVENDKVIMRGGTFRRGFIGDHKIATINAKAIESGLAKFSADEVTLLAGDGTGAEVKVADTEDDTTTLYVVNADGTSEGGDTDDAIGIKAVASVFIITDIDGDGKVTLGDISRFMSAWANKATIYDFNGDGVMSFRDFGIILADSFLR